MSAVPPVIPAKTLSDLSWPQLLAQLARRCHTELGSLRAVHTPFLTEPEQAAARIVLVTELRTLRGMAEHAPFAGLQDVDGPLLRADKGAVLEPDELVAVGETARACGRLRDFFRAHRELAPGMLARIQPMSDLSRVGGAMLDAFDEDGKLADGASRQLGKLRRKARALHDEAMHRFKEILDDPNVAAVLQDSFYTQRDNRYVLPLRSDSYTRVPGIVHGTSGSGNTLFVEPQQFVGLNNRLKIAASEVYEEEQRILQELSGYVREQVVDIRKAVEISLAVDLLDAAARLADDMRATAPTIQPTGGRLWLKEARHPLMELSERACVPNDLELPAGTTLVISGPNAGGKTVALKTAGLAALMTRAGLHVPADHGSCVPWFRAVHTDIGDDQSLERDLSTFSAHIIHLRELLEDADDNTLVLIDEVAVGTAPEQGAALAQAVLEEFAERGVRAMVTTHYERVKTIAASDERFRNASVGFDMESLQPTYLLHVGAPGSSGALIVSRKLGLPEKVAARAEELLGKQRSGVDELLASIDDERRKLELRSAEVDERAAQIGRELARAVEARRLADERLKKARETAHSEAIDALRNARDEADRLRKEMRKSRKKVDGSVLSGISSDIAAHAPQVEVQGDLVPERQLVPGTRVLVPGMGGAGEVVEAPRRGKVTVLVGSVKIALPVAGVRLDTSKKPSHTGGGGKRWQQAAKLVERTDDSAPARTIDNTLDLRGERVDAALARVDRFLDDCMMAQRDVVFVIHGHGTGALRSAVREHAKLHPAVQRWRTGKLSEGGEGITVYWLDV